MNPEKIVQITYNSVIQFLQRILGVDKMTYILNHLNKSFPSWDHKWSTIQKWLVEEHPMTNMQHTIHSFAQLFPDYESFANDLNQSLALHDEFWNQVYIQLCIAKEGLKC